MTSEIMRDWLRWFDERMSGWKVVLLMDNFSAHDVALRQINASDIHPQNTRVVYLPANSTSRSQPLDQGIINAWKLHYNCTQHLAENVRRNARREPSV